MKHLWTLGLIAAACGAQAATLYQNGNIVDGSNLSILDAGSTSLGVTSTTTAPIQILADNFSVSGASWSVSSLDFYAYQTNAVGFTFTNVNWSLRSGSDINTATTLASGTTAVTNGGLVGYRVTSTTLTSTARAIYRINADIPDIVLAAGSYFVTFQLSGTVASGPFVPPVLGSLGTGNSLFSSTGTTFSAVADGGSLLPLDLPFTIQGSVVPEPASLALLLAGGLTVGAVVRRRRQA